MFTLNKSPPPVSLLSQSNPVHNVIFCLIYISVLSFHLRLSLPSRPFPSFSDKDFNAFLIFLVDAISSGHLNEYRVKQVYSSPAFRVATEHYQRLSFRIWTDCGTKCKSSSYEQDLMIFNDYRINRNSRKPMIQFRGEY
jgi:hypothetical protein